MISLPFTNSLPKPKSDYLVSLSTPFGIMQHTSFTLADPHFGYATDDNARSLIAANFFRHEEKKYLFQELEERYLKFLKFMQSKDGQFYCYLTFDLKKEGLGVGDWFSRSLFALSFLLARSERFDQPALSIIWHSLPLILSSLTSNLEPRTLNFSLRTRAYLLLAFYYLLREYEKASQRGSSSQRMILKKKEVDQLYRLIRLWGKNFLERLKKHQERRWVWPESQITYDNGKIIQAYFLLGELLNKEEFTSQGKRVLDFYLGRTMKKGYFRAPGNAHGQFWQKGEVMPYHDEQPIEAYSLISALVTANLSTKQKHYLEKAKTVYLWFFGKNRLKLSLVDKKTGAVSDALKKKALNVNRGAESYLSLLLSYFALQKKWHL